MADLSPCRALYTQANDSEQWDVDSLFDSVETPSMSDQWDPHPAAQRTCPPIPGLFFTPSLTIPTSLADTLVSHCQRYFQSAGQTCVNQVMLFGRHTAQGSGLPPFLDELIPALSLLLGHVLPTHVHRLLFPQDHVHLSRQAILNHYEPGEGITPHVDLLKRFGDGILGISLGSGTVMTFERVVGDAETLRSRHDVYLPERSIIVLTGEARYHWKHGIEERQQDYVEMPGEGGAGYAWIERKERISITLRWLLPGADVVGGDG